MNNEEVLDHRSRRAAERRKQTRAKLLDSAMLVFSQKGPQAAVIDDVVAHAGMTRGSFYNYFQTNEELLAAVAETVSDDLLRIIDPLVLLQKDPVHRVACGARLLLHTVVACPSIDSHLAGIGFLARDIADGIEQGKFPQISHRVAMDVVIGVLFCAAHSLSRGPLPDDYPEAIVRAMLHGLGVSGAALARAAALPLPQIALDESSILVRTRDI
jgi:AcrR family transcriptional regulator